MSLIRFPYEKGDPGWLVAISPWAKAPLCPFEMEITHFPGGKIAYQNSNIQMSCWGVWFMFFLWWRQVKIYDDTSIFLFPMSYCSIFNCPLFLFPIFRQEKLKYRKFLQYLCSVFLFPKCIQLFYITNIFYLKNCFIKVCRYIEHFFV